jgi:hypothetical protein
LFHGVIKTKWSDATKDTKDKVIDGLNKTNVDDGVTKESEEAKDRENRYKKNRNPDDDYDSFIFSIFLVDVVVFDDF